MLILRNTGIQVFICRRWIIHCRDRLYFSIFCSDIKFEAAVREIAIHIIQQLIDKTNEQAEKIKSGEIKVVNAQIGEEFDPATCPRITTKTA